MDRTILAGAARSEPEHFPERAGQEGASDVGQWQPGRTDSHALVNNRVLLGLLCPDWRGPCAAIHTDTAELLFANRPAQALIEDGRDLRVSGASLAFSDAAAQRLFLGALARLRDQGAPRASFLVADRTTPGWIAVRLFRPRSGMPGAMDAAFGADGMRRIVLVELSSTSAGLDVADLGAISSAFGLTPAETQLVGALARNRSLAEVASERRVALSTVRQRHKNVLAKTGCRRQSELVALALALA